MKFNLKFNFRSIRFRTWLYFLLFAGVLLLIIWFLQIYLLDNNYSKTKEKLTNQTATVIAGAYSVKDKKNSLRRVIEEAQLASSDDDLYFRIDENGKTIYPETPDIRYQDDIRKVYQHLQPDSNGEIPMSSRSYGQAFTDKDTTYNYYTYGLYLDTRKNHQIILYTVSPLKPVSSTQEILQAQLVLVMIIALGLAFVLALFMSTQITRPILAITKSARRLASGEYGIDFPTSRKQHSEIRYLSKTLTMASKELEKSIALQKDLLANVSHDIRTPLTMIKSYAEMIRDLSGDNPKKRNAHLQVIINEADRLNVLVTDMLELSRMQSGTMDLKISAFDMKQAVEEVIDPYRILENNEDYDISFNCNDHYMVIGDEDRIKQVVSNLLTNAIKYAGSDKKIIINIKHWGKRIHFEIIDHGVGIKPEELAHIWDRYYKTSSNHVRTSSGSGLGLSIVKEILSLHSSKFGVESKVGKGTTFWFELKMVEKPSTKKTARKGRYRVIRNRNN